MALRSRVWRRPRWRMALALGVLLLVSAFAGCGLPTSLPFTGGSAIASSVTVPAEIRRGSDRSTLVVVNLMINGKGPYAFALDTGASLTLIDLAIAEQLRLPVAGPPETIGGIGGKQRVTPVTVSVWALGAATLPATTITSAPLTYLRQSAGIVGLLGSDVLSQFGSVTIDYANSQVILTSPS